MQSCITRMCQQIAFQAQNSDGEYTSLHVGSDVCVLTPPSTPVFLGYVGWSAGNFQPGSYVLVSSRDLCELVISYLTTMIGRNTIRRRIIVDRHTSGPELYGS